MQQNLWREFDGNAAAGTAVESGNVRERKAMKTIQKITLAITTTIIVVADAQAGRWLSRDPIEEGAGFVQRDPMPQWKFFTPKQNEPNLYTFVRNDPLSRFDFLGLCAGKCGVKNLEFVNQGWTITSSDYAFKFDVVIKYRKGNGYDPSCCRYIQWVQHKAYTWNGQPASTNQGGVPIDGRLHVDSWPYRGDNDTNPGGYVDTDSSDVGFRLHDEPGFGPFSIGDVINDDRRFRGTVIDICNGNKLVTSKDFKMSATGTWPTLTYEP